MTRLLLTWPGKVGAIGLALVLGLLGFMPLLDGPGYESALVAGLLVPLFAAVVTALEVSKSGVRHRASGAGEDGRGNREQGTATGAEGKSLSSPLDAVSRGAANGAVLGLIAYVITLGHGLRVGLCDLWDGSAHFGLGAGVGAVMGGVWGAVAGEIAGRVKRRRLVAVITAFAGPLASIAVSLWRFYTSPMIFAYDPFVGYFSGSLYDTVIDFTGLVTYRAGSAATLLFVFMFALHLRRNPRGGLSFHSIGRPFVLVLGGIALAASLVLMVNGDKLGHWQTSHSIAWALGGRAKSQRCDIFYSREIPWEAVERFGRECDAHIEVGEQWLGAGVLEDGAPLVIRVYLFSSAGQKADLMGAAKTNIAKPWRKEVYVQGADYPHGVLGHEIMHVLTGGFARGPFRIAGRWGGWLPNPGLIEGIAEAGSPRESDLTLGEWAKAMRDLGMLPPLSRLFALGFLGENSSTAYTASGAFVAYIRSTHGAEALRNWYGGGDLSELTGASWQDLEAGWHKTLDDIVLPEAAAVQAKARFDRPALFGRRCPHVVDACKREVEQLRGIGDAKGALLSYQKVMELDEDPMTRVVNAELQLAASDVQEGISSLESIAADEALPRHVRDRAMEKLGDIALREGQVERAVGLYRQVMERVIDEDKLRTLEVKVGAAGDELARRAVVELLIGSARQGPDKVTAVELLGVWAERRPGEGLPSYLLARRYFNDGYFEQARDYMDAALGADLPIERVRMEAERLRMVIGCGLGDVATAERMYDKFAGHKPLVSEARLGAARRFLSRCRKAGGWGLKAGGRRDEEEGMRDEG